LETFQSCIGASFVVERNSSSRIARDIDDFAGNIEFLIGWPY
jgi:hypothetical protein